MTLALHESDGGINCPFCTRHFNSGGAGSCKVQAQAAIQTIIAGLIKAGASQSRPNFGKLYSHHEGVTLECRAIAPGLSLHDLMMVFEEAEKACKPGDEFAGNPSKWPTMLGINAVVEAVLVAVYSAPDIWLRALAGDLGLELVE